MREAFFEQPQTRGPLTGTGNPRSFTATIQAEKLQENGSRAQISLTGAISYELKLFTELFVFGPLITALRHPTAEENPA